MNAIRFFLSGICHQIPSHCLHLEGQALPLCARCTGTFGAAALALILFWALGRGRRSGLPARRPALMLGALAGAWALDGINSMGSELLGRNLLYPPSNLLRLATGAGFGVALGAILYPVIQMALWPDPDERPATQTMKDLAPALATSAGVVLTLYFWTSAPLRPWAIALGLVALGLLGLVNGLLIAMLARPAGFARRIRQAIPFLLLGVLAALAETGSVALLRQWLSV